MIVASGWDLTNFRRNPVVPWAHDYTRPPVGKVTRVKVVGRQLIADIEFDTENAFAADIARQYKDGYLNAVSVGFRPLEAEGRDVRGVRFKRAELLEISAVPVPMHPAALRKEYAREEDTFDRLANAVRAMERTRYQGRGYDDGSNKL